MTDTAPKAKSLKGMKNVYMCHTCGHGFISMDVDDGVTPFSTTCRHPGCGKPAFSFFYRAPQEMLARVPAAIEWYRPSTTADLSPAVRSRVEQGGLISRPNPDLDASHDCAIGETPSVEAVNTQSRGEE